MFFSDIIHLTGIYNPVTLSYEVWDGSLSVGGVTIGQVDQGAPGALAWKVDGSAVTQPVSIAGSVPVTSATLATEATLAALNAKVTAVNTGAVVVASSALPTGAATLAGQTQPGVDIGDVTVNNAAGAAAVNIQDGGNSITVDGAVTVTGSVTANAGTNLNTSALALDASITTLTTAVNTLLKPANTLAAVTAITNPVTVNVGLTDAQLRATPVPVSGTVSATSSATATVDDPTYTEAQAAAFSQDLGGRLRTLGYGLVADAPPTYLPDQIKPLSLNTEGRLRVSIVPAATYLEFFRTDDELSFNVPMLTDAADLWAVGSANPYP